LDRRWLLASHELAPATVRDEGRAEVMNAVLSTLANSAQEATRRFATARLSAPNRCTDG
jgi:hypothetical protein